MHAPAAVQLACLRRIDLENQLGLQGLSVAMWTQVMSAEFHLRHSCEHICALKGRFEYWYVRARQSQYVFSKRVQMVIR